MFFDIDNEFMNIKFNIIGETGDYSNISFNEFKINDVNVIDYTENGSITIGNFGCMDELACNYSSEANIEDNSCEYIEDCFGVCGGDASEDCLGQCAGLAYEDSYGDCCTDQERDQCGKCDGDMFEDINGFYPDGSCDCDGAQPFIYCVDGDGDGLGNPDYSFIFCELINNIEFPDLVLDCSDMDDGCIEDEFDACGLCGGGGPNSITNCCPNTGLSILGDSPDNCGECGGNMFQDVNNGFYPDGSCDCNETPPISYCIDYNEDGASDSEPILFCYEPPSDIFINCNMLDINNVQINSFDLFSAYPNPFNPNITINYYVDNPDFVSIKILDLNGRHVENLVSKFAASGNHLINWEPREKVPSGIYIVEFKYGNQLFAKKINYIK